MNDKWLEFTKKKIAVIYFGIRSHDFKYRNHYVSIEFVLSQKLLIFKDIIFAVL